MNAETPQQQAPAHTAADLFKEVADRLMNSDTRNFCGAFLVVPPQGDPRELILYSNQNAATFWALLKTTADNALEELAKMEAAGQLQQRGWR